MKVRTIAMILTLLVAVLAIGCSSAPTPTPTPMFYPGELTELIRRDLGETPTGLGGSTPQRVGQQTGVLEVSTIRGCKRTLIPAPPGHIYLATGVPTRIDQDSERPREVKTAVCTHH